MNMPKRVQELADEAERLQAQYVSDFSQEPVQPPPADPGQDPVDAHQPVAPQVPPAPAPVSPTPSESPSDETWEQRYRTVQGKYSAEVPRLSAELKDLRDRFAVTASELERIKGKQAEAPKAKTPLVTDKDVEAFGSDLIDVIDRKAREVAESMVDTRMGELEGENRKLRDQLTGVTERQVVNDRQAYFTELARQVPDYEALNVDQGFMDWLADVDPLSGSPRQEYLNKAWTAFDAGRTAVLFNAYKQLKVSASNVPTAPAQQEPMSQTKQQLQRQVAPSRSRLSTDPSSSTPSKIWTAREIEGFYADVRKGRYYGKDTERAQVESEIDQAVAQGRVR